MHFDLVSPSGYTSEPHSLADRNLCSKMELSCFRVQICIHSTRTACVIQMNEWFRLFTISPPLHQLKWRHPPWPQSNVRDEPKVSQRPHSCVSTAEHLTLHGVHSIFTFCQTLKDPLGSLLSFVLCPCLHALMENPRQHRNSNYHAKTCPGCLLF